MKKRVLICIVSLLTYSVITAWASNENDSKKGNYTETSIDYPFCPSEDCYAKDRYNVYCNGNKIDGANPDSFIILKDGYTKDRWDVYYRGVKIEGQTNSSFTVLGRGYAKDSWNVYYEGKVLKDAHASSFVVLQ